MVHCDIATSQAPNSTYRHPEIHSHSADVAIKTEISPAGDTFQSLIAECEKQLLNLRKKSMRTSTEYHIITNVKEAYKKAQEIVKKDYVLRDDADKIIIALRKKIKDTIKRSRELDYKENTLLFLEKELFG